MSFRILGLSIALCLSACSQTQVVPEQDNAPQAIEVRKSPNDDRDYRYLVLDNKLQVLLVSDATTDRAAASLVVNRGSFHEPQNRPGLAHFLEHMLFIQTETYPEVDGFQAYVTGNGGSSNAYTALDHTNYFFDIQPSAFREGVDRFAHFFIDPIISDEYAQREKNAVHSEYQMQIKEDGWRGYMVSKQTLNPAHPGAKFTIGSLSTLAGDIQADLVKFFEEHYSADQMALVALSNESLDELEAWIVPLFSQIANRDAGPIYPEVPLYGKGALPARLEVKKEKAGAELSFDFPVPSVRPHYRNKPQQYLANLLGHEGEGSLHHYLNNQGWIESLSAGVSDFDHNNSIFNVTVRLTPAGEAAEEAVSSALFGYLDMLR
ncbi:MAG: insulinase family protein, partial [Pseudomonadota bacterium]